ncbi:hypothetical protein [uncultured Roseibium sp.]|uniref:hypothetical protein n=1 Tax=uncultured Roseibium sp. TaxID=1936171 RepID=UPI0026028410|nr:hypothetical protein [uncultured Roseibium sp.]
MPGQLQEITDLLRQRLSVVQQLAAANAEHHRLLQFSGGADFLTLHASDERDEDKPQNPAAPALDANAALLDDLNAKLEQIDKLIEKANTKGKRHE